MHTGLWQEMSRMALARWGATSMSLTGILDTVRPLPDENDPDAARARVDEIARALAGVLGA